MGLVSRLRGRPAPDPRLAEHEARAGKLYRSIGKQYERVTEEEFDGATVVTYEGPRRGEFSFWTPLEDTPAGRRLLAQPPEVLASALVVAAADASAGWAQMHSPSHRVLAALSRRRLPLEREDAHLLLRLALEHAGKWSFFDVLKAALGALEEPTPELERPLRKALAVVERDDTTEPGERARLRARLRALLPGDDELDLSLVDRGDEWGTAVRSLLPKRFPDAGPLLLHLAGATGSRPTAKWRREAERLLDGELVRALLEAVVEADAAIVRTVRFEGREYHERRMLTEKNATLVRGTLWALAVLDPDWGPELAASVLDAAVTTEIVANACLYALGELSGERAVAELSRLKARVKHRGVQKLIDRALERSAERAGVSRSQLVERLVPAHGLERGGRREVGFGAWTAIVAVDHRRVSLTWRGPDAKERRSAPAGVDAGELKAEVKELRAELTTQRVRLESLLAAERTWPGDEWRRYYLDHPLVGVLARGLIWSFDGEPGLGSDAPEGAREVRLWHPIDADRDDVAQWRRRLLERELVQPFKQAFREVYLLAPAEERTRIYSNRFAGHILRYPQTYALLKERGWSGNALGPWDGGFDATLRREFPEQGIVAEFYIELVESEPTGTIADLASTDQVRFRRDGEQLPLAEVPPVVFSEAMRDVDLFVAVSSIAADPTWFDRGEERFGEYWETVSFGELTESAQVRRDALAEILSRLQIADRLELGERFLRVRGDLRSYKIHLGSANVLMEPNDAYLCIVPAGRARTTKLFLPFEEERLNVILSKAFLLANDARIEDETIRAQIERR